MLKLWQKIRFRLQKTASEESVKKLAEIGKTALLAGEAGIDQRYVHGPEADATLKLAEAASKLITNLGAYNEAIIRAGPLLIVKMTQNGKPKLAVETMSNRLRRTLDENPRLLESPALLFETLEKLGDRKKMLPPLESELKELR